MQYYGTTKLDARALLIPLVGFLPASDGRVRSTVDAIERHLMTDGLVMRYDPEQGEDGLGCLEVHFWARNDVGLLSEEYDTKLGRMLGNYRRHTPTLR